MLQGPDPRAAAVGSPPPHLARETQVISWYMSGRGASGYLMTRSSVTLQLAQDVAGRWNATPQYAAAVLDVRALKSGSRLYRLTLHCVHKIIWPQTGSIPGMPTILRCPRMMTHTSIWGFIQPHVKRKRPIVLVLIFRGALVRGDVLP